METIHDLWSSQCVVNEYEGIYIKFFRTMICPCDYLQLSS